jgi:hypothetical protein
VRKSALKNKGMKFTALLHHVTVDLLRESFGLLKRKAAPRVDGMTWQGVKPGWKVEYPKQQNSVKKPLEAAGRRHRALGWFGSQQLRVQCH